MNYFDSEVYRSTKKQLKGEYAICYKKIETYILANSLKMDALSKVLDDLLLAQEQGNPISKVTGSNVIHFCDNLIYGEKKSKKRKLYIIEMFATFLLLLMILTIVKPLFTIAGGRSLNFTEFSHLLQFSSLEIASLCLIFVYFLIKWITTKAFFEHPIISKIILYTVYLIIICSISILPDYLIRKIISKISLFISVPFSIFIIITVIAISILIVCNYISNKDKTMYIKLVEHEDINLEQVKCPKCGKEHDFDYPKCPYCKYQYKD